ncbi:Dehydrogenase/reductase [Chlamydiales bacterium STE3]|nr:Dehydrogenase/reductase [Chlamydiales bacterium STE3]
MSHCQNLALVTGASSGIGAAISRELIQQGWKVIGVARSHDKLAKMREELSEAFIPVVCDVANKKHIHEVSQQLIHQRLCPTLFFLNAGIAGEAVLENPEHFDLAMHEKIMQTNYFGVLAWVEYWEKLCQQNGKTNFIVTSSINAIFAPPRGSAYCASKAAIARAFESLSLTYFGTNLNFSVMYPGPVDTAGLKGNLPFTWSAEKMGKRMVKFAFSGKTVCQPFLFYNILSRFLRLLPARYTMRLIGKVE